MKPERWRQIEPILERALELTERARRAAFVAEACAGDESLRREVEALIAAYDDAESFIEKPLLGARLTPPDGNGEEPDAMIGERVGAYRIMVELGRGGMGAVYLAERADSEFRKRVAVKLIKRGMDSDYILRRFRNERQILAALDHPNIALMLDGGTTPDGRPYFVMEYIAGKPLNEYCDEHQLPVRERLRLFQKVCSAVAYAHQKLVIHRDLKPSNIMVTEEGMLKLLDFGIAKLLNPELADGTLAPTTLSSRLMTPEYASPEQVQGLNVTPESDQYSLGVMLYELITGHRPYRLRSHAPLEMLHVICEEEPERPSIVVARTEEAGGGGREKARITPQAVSANRRTTLDALREELEKGLDHVILRALRKSAAERYPSVAELSADIERFLEGKPVLARAMPLSAKAGGAQKSKEATTRPRSIAVLPFKLLSQVRNDESGDAFLGLGLADSLITRLSAIKSLTVRPTSAVLKYGGDVKDLSALGRKLNVGFILEGRILRAGARLRVTVQLVNVRDESALWAEQFDENFTDILSVQDSISEQVARSLAAHLTGDEREQLAKHGTDNPLAYEAYLRGRFHWHAYTEDGLAQAIQYFQKAVALDPNFAAAHSGIADYYTWLSVTSVLPPEEAFQSAKEAASRAISLDDKLAEAHASLAFVTWAYDWDDKTSERLFRRAFALNNNYPQAHEWYAHVCAARGDFDEAIGEMKRARELDPHSAQLNAMTAYIHHYARRHAEGVKFIDRSIEIDPNNYIALQGVGWMYPPVGRAHEAIPACAKGVEVSGRFSLTVWILALVLIADGQGEAGCRLLEELHEMSKRRYVSAYYFAVIYTALGDFDNAFEWLNQVLNRREYWSRWIAIEPRLDPLGSDSRYNRLLKRLEDERRESAYANVAKEGLPPVAAVETRPLSNTTAADISPQSLTERRAFRPLVLLLVLAVAAGALLLAYRSLRGHTSATENASATNFPSPNMTVKRLTTSGQEHLPAISPDGRYVAHVAVAGRMQSLWLRQADAETSQQVVAPAEVVYLGVTFSPDNKFLYYTTANYTSIAGTLYRVPLTGGAPERILEPISNAVGFAPDGQHFAYTIMDEPTGEGKLIIAGTDGSGAPRVIATRHFPNFFYGNPAWSPDGRMIAVPVSNFSQPAGGFQVAAFRADTGAEEVVTSHTYYDLPAISWLRDGSGLVMSANDGTSSAMQLWLAPYPSAAPRRLTNDLNSYEGLGMTADSSALVTAKSDIQSGVWTVQLNGPELDPRGVEQPARRITTGVGRQDGINGLRWTEGGRIIYVASAGDNNEVWMMDAEGAHRVQLPVRMEQITAVSMTPDDRYVILSAFNKGQFNIWRLEVASGALVRLTSGNLDFNAVLTPDGKSVIYIGVASSGRMTLRRVSLDGGEPVELTTYSVLRPSVSPDGRFIACNFLDAEPGAHWKVGILSIEGGAPLRALDLSANSNESGPPAIPLAWTPDSRSLLYVLDGQEASNIWTIPAEGGAPRQITHFVGGRIFNFAPSPDGQRLALARGTVAQDIVLFKNLR